MFEDDLRQHRNVLATLAQRRHAQLQHVQPVVQVLAERAGGNHRGQILVARAHHAHVHGVFPTGADLAHAPLLQRAQQLHLHGQRQVGHLVQQQRAAVRGVEETAALGVGARERALHVAEEFRLHQRLGNRAAVHGHERVRGAGAHGVDGARRALLAAARFAADHHRRHAARQPRQRAAHLLHGRGQPRQQSGGAVGRFRGLGSLGAARAALGGVTLLAAQRVQDQGAQLVERDRLGDVVERAGLERIDGIVGAAVGGDHGHRRALGRGRQLPHNLDAQPVAQPHVGQHQAVAALRQPQPRLGQRAGHHHVVTHAAQRDVQQLAQVGLVVDDEYRIGNGRSGGHGVGVGLRGRRIRPGRPGRPVRHRASRSASSAQMPWPAVYRERRARAALCVPATVPARWCRSAPGRHWRRTARAP
ncbi:hypothetical protein D3C72_1035170 [compost metagenome]